MVELDGVLYGDVDPGSAGDLDLANPPFESETQDPDYFVDFSGPDLIATPVLSPSLSRTATARVKSTEQRPNSNTGAVAEAVPSAPRSIDRTTTLRRPPTMPNSNTDPATGRTTTLRKPPTIASDLFGMVDANIDEEFGGFDDVADELLAVADPGSEAFEGFGAVTEDLIIDGPQAPGHRPARQIERDLSFGFPDDPVVSNL